MTKQVLFHKIDQQYTARKPDLAPLLTEQTIQILHHLCCPEEAADSYRCQELNPTGKGHKPPHPDELDHFMNHFINQLELSHAMFHPVEFASIAYKRLLDLSPFASRNEETAALFLNMLLAAQGYPIIRNPVELEGYSRAMEKARSMPFPDTDDLSVLIGKEILGLR